MSDTILSGDFTVYYLAENRQKRIVWTGTSGTYAVQQLYSALQDLFDESAQMDDGVPLSAQTPTDYTIGIIDAGARDPWYIDPISTQYLRGGAIQTVNWQRIATSNTGIVRVPISGGNIVSGDIGFDITHGDGDSGTLLYVESGYLHIRPDSSATANNFDSTSGTLTCNGHTATQTAAASTGETIFSNIFTLGTIQPNTEMYVYQGTSALTQWWGTGHIDILVPTTYFGVLNDTGLLTVFARQYSKFFDHFTVQVASGGRTPVPIATNSDINNQTGYRTLTGSSGSGTFDIGNYIYVGASWAAATKKGVVTAVAGTTGSPILTYYLIGNLTDFSASDAVQELVAATLVNGDASCTAGAPSASGPSASPSSTLTIGFGGIERDLSNGNGNRPYSVELDLQGSISVSALYQRVKYLTRRGETADIDTQTSQTIVGQSYRVIGDYYLPYDTGSIDNPFTEGETITATGSFSCILTSKHDQGTSEGFLIVRNVRGTIPVDNTTLTGATSGHTALIDEDTGNDPVAPISEFKQSPFGTFAGGRFFGARGVWLANVPSSDATNYELVDSEGIRQVPPNTVPITVTGVTQNTQCYVADSTPTIYLNTEATSLVSGNRYQASTSLNYTTDIDVVVRAREMGYLPFETSGTITQAGISVTAVWLADPNWKLIVTNQAITFTNNDPSPDTIERASGSFITDGWLAVMGQVTVSGSSSNDGTYTIASLTATTLTLSVTNTLTSVTDLSNAVLTYARRSI